jgi:hypothetical protein
MTNGGHCTGEGKGPGTPDGGGGTGRSGSRSWGLSGLARPPEAKPRRIECRRGLLCSYAVVLSVWNSGFGT